MEQIGIVLKYIQGLMMLKKLAKLLNLTDLSNGC